MLDSRFWMLDTRFWMLDTRKKFYRRERKCRRGALTPAGFDGHCIQRLEPPVKQACHAGAQPQSAINNGYASKLVLSLIVEGFSRIFCHEKVILLYFLRQSGYNAVRRTGVFLASPLPSALTGPVFLCAEFCHSPRDSIGEITKCAEILISDKERYNKVYKYMHIY